MQSPTVGQQDPFVVASRTSQLQTTANAMTTIPPIAVASRTGAAAAACPRSMSRWSSVVGDLWTAERTCVGSGSVRSLGWDSESGHTRAVGGEMGSEAHFLGLRLEVPVGRRHDVASTDLPTRRNA